MLLSGNIAGALTKLESLRRHLDGCGASADTNDWITSCAEQSEIRELVDFLISNVGR